MGRYVSLESVSNYERRKKGKIYPKGTSLIQISATRDQNVDYLNEDKEVDSKYLAVVPKENINPIYLYEAIKREMPDFCSKYQTGLNIQLEAFKFFQIQIVSEEEQKEFVKAIIKVNKILEKEEKILRELEDMKKYALENMMI